MTANPSPAPAPADARASADWFDRLAAIVDELDVSDYRAVSVACRRARGVLDSVEATSLALAANGDRKRAERLAKSDGNVSARGARNAAARAAAVEASDGALAHDVAQGTLSTEQLDVIAQAAVADPRAANDRDLIGRVAAAPVDQGRRIAEEWKAERSDADKLATAHQRQRSRRRAHRFYNSARDLHALTLEGDKAAIDEAWNLITLRERAMYDADGGRDVSPSEHERTSDQRMFDAALELLRAGPSGAGGTRPSVVITVPVAVSAAQPGMSDSDAMRSDGDLCESGVQAGGLSPPGTTPTPAVEPAALPTVLPSLLPAREPGWRPPPPVSIGSGAVSQQVLEDALIRSDISIVLVDSMTQRPLALGRTRRHANRDQFLALVVRDTGCVLCGRHWLHCQSHHITPWNAPGKGVTDLNNLALVCSHCHHEIHSQHRTLVRAPDGTWTTRPAYQHEIAPARPQKSPRARPKNVDRGRSGRAETEEHLDPLLE